MKRSPPTHFKIGALAHLADVAVDTIRYYEREGLLPAPQRRKSGYREYDADAVERVRFIRRAKELGFTLGEIRSLLSLATDAEHGVEGVQRKARERLQELDRQVADLTSMRDRLAQLLAACPGQGDPGCCPILNSLHGAEPVPPVSSDCCS
ncbi:heavy metal-responsive transcriptional regulator [Rhodomicrobium lacus]|jgi:MerR family copper efflux transcriptional regulator|uniref:heavy metal-responsive transcriptional regulator n=1 Tax=Rhodomicrobium TaxID=1068 RepID=UPI000F8C8B21|nr:heavy metal-responsive transcriptional regulator [Rhodomicrobium lacus]